MLSLLVALLSVLSMTTFANHRWVIALIGTDLRLVSPISAFIGLLLSISLLLKIRLTPTKHRNIIVDGITLISASIAVLMMANIGTGIKEQLLDYFFSGGNGASEVVFKYLMSDVSAIMVLLYALGHLLERLSETKYLKLINAGIIVYLISFLMTCVIFFSYISGFPIVSSQGTYALSLVSTTIFFLLNLGALLHCYSKHVTPTQRLASKANDKTTIYGFRFLDSSWFIIAVIIILAFFAIYLRVDSAIFKRTIESQLTSIVDIKDNQIEAFLKERKADARGLKREILLNQASIALLNDRQNKPLQEAIRSRIIGLRAERVYSTVGLYDTMGKSVIIVSDDTTNETLPNNPELSKAISSNEIVMSDLFFDDQSHNPLHDKIHLRLYVPITDLTSTDLSVKGVWVLEINPYDNLYPLLSSLTSLMKTGETILYRKDGNSILFLSEVKYKPDAALKLRVPIASNSQVLAVQAIMGATGLVEGFDYSGNRVVGISRPIAGTNWYIVNKVSLTEVQAPFTTRGRLTGIILIAFFVGAALFVESNFRKKESIKNAQTAGEWQATFNAISDAVLMIDRSLNIIRVNQSINDVLSIEPSSILGQNAVDFLHSITGADKTVLFDSFKDNKPGPERVQCAGKWLFVSVDPILDDVDICSGHVLTISDITSTYEAQSLIRKSEEKFRNIFEHTTVGTSLTAPDGRLSVNQSFAQMLGYSVEELITNWKTISYAEDLPETQKIVSALLKGEISDARFKKRYIHKDGRIIWADVSTYLQRDNEGNPEYFITSVSDISLEILYQQQLSETNQYLENLINYANAPIIVWDSKYLITRYNPAFADIKGISCEDIVGQHISVLFLPDKVEQYMELIQKTAAGVRWEVVEIEILNLNGNICTLLWNSATLYGTDEVTPIATIAQGMDITERKRYEVELRIKDQAFEDSLAAQSVTDVNYIITHVNQAYLKMWGYSTKGEAIGQSVSTFFANPTDATPIIEALIAHDIWEGEFQAKTKDGKPFITRGYITVMRNPQGEMIGCQSTNLDVTEEKQNIIALREAKETLEQRVTERTKELTKSKQLLEETGRLAKVGGWECNLVTNTVIWASVVCQIHEVEPNYQPSLETGLSFYAPESLPIITDAVSLCISEGKPYDLEILLITAKNNKLWVRAVGRASQENGITTMISGVFQDINERKLIEIELRNNRDRLVASNQELEAFSYSVSHDLRAPLRHISGYIELFDKNFRATLTEKGTHYLDTILDSAQQMGRLIDDLLAFSRTGRVAFNMAKFDMGDVVQGVLKSISGDIVGRDIEWMIDPMPFVLGDIEMLKLAWTNLILNAVKFSALRKPAIIEIGYKEHPDKYEFYIKDNGVGFDMKYADKLFGVFQRLHPTTDFDGTGIGLANVRRIISKHGGETWAAAEADKGATFSFTLYR